jgi:hypothetical protein
MNLSNVKLISHYIKQDSRGLKIREEGILDVFASKLFGEGFENFFYILIYKFWEYFRGGAYFISPSTPFNPLHPPV